MKPATAIDLMAQAIVRCAMDRQEVHRIDLERLGLTSEQIDTYRGEAYRRACLTEPRVAQCLGDPQ